MGSKKVLIVIFILAALGGTFYFLKRPSAPLSFSEVPVTTANIGVVSSGALPIKTEPVAPRASPASLTSKLSPPDQKKYQVLMEIFSTRNDNDPRFDTDLKQLSPELRNAIESYYHQSPPEKRNERGTVVFLIARSLENQSDVDFLKGVLTEPPCLSLSDCSKAAPPATGEQAHLDGLNATTANYPQLTAIRQSFEAYQRIASGDNPNPELANSILEMLKEAEQSPNPRVAQEARNTLKSLKN